MTISGQGTRNTKKNSSISTADSVLETNFSEPEIAQLRQTAEKYSRMIQASPDAITLRSFPERRYIEVNEGFTRLTGYSPEEVIGKTPSDLQLWVDSEPHEIAAHRLQREGEIREEEFRFRTKAGEIRHGRVSASRVTVNGQPCMLAITHDITDRKLAEQALVRSEADFRSLVEGAPYGIYRVTPNGRLLLVNPAFVRILGYASEEEVLELDMGNDVYRDPEVRRRFVANFSGSNFANVVTEWIRKDGVVITVQLTGKAVPGDGSPIDYFENFVEDITDRRSLERQLLQSQKMDAIGRLAGGVAHDFNNLLSVILGHGEILERRFAEDPAFRKGIEAIQQAAEKAASLTAQLLAFSRKQMIEPKIVDPNAAILEIQRLVRRLMSEDIEFSIRLQPGVGAIRIDPGQFDQVLMNLIINARDSMPSGGRIVVETSNVELDDAYVRQHIGSSPGNCVCLSVSDTGTGMDAETMSHIFEPFFTTKEQGKGTGLGLSTVYGIVKQAGGYIMPYSEPGHGSTFRLYFPRAEESVRSQQPSAASEPLPRGSETVLLVEDEEALRDLIRTVLQEAGYTVLHAHKGQEALRIAADPGFKIDLLLTDVVMPGLAGPQLARQLLASRPGLRVLFMSGYADDVIVNRGVLSSGSALIQKPFSRKALLTRIRQLLEDNP
jgi:two-component system, cell cycle sensor histidine kinase and response regulator CckA